MKANELYPGMQVRCVSAIFGGDLPEMKRQIGNVVTIHEINSYRGDGNEEVTLEETGYLIWSPDDFEPVMNMVSVSDQDLDSILFGV